MRSGIVNRVLANYAEKRDKKDNFGLFVAAAEPIGENSAKLVIGSIHQLTSDALCSYVYKATDNKLVPMVSSAVTYENKKNGLFYTSIFAYRAPVQFKPANEENIKGMVQIKANTYLDESHDSVWSKVEKDGVPYFMRANEDKVEDILEKSKSLTAAVMRASVEDFKQPVKQNDHVEFFALDEDGNAGKAIGKIKEVKDADLVVAVGEEDKQDDCESVTIPASAVIRVIPMEAASSIKEVLDYLAQAYPDAYKARLKEIK